MTEVLESPNKEWIRPPEAAVRVVSELPPGEVLTEVAHLAQTVADT